MGEEVVNNREDIDSKSVNILYQSSGSYAPIMGVSLTSLFENNTHIESMDVYITDGGIEEKDRKKIKELCARYHRNVYFISGNSIDKMLSLRGIAKWRNSYAVYYKLFALELINKPISRLLALDADTIINKTVDALYYSELEGKPLGMVQDFMPHSYMKKIGMKENETYYNSGVVLFDVEQWKKRKCFERIEAFLKGNMDCILYADQDAISIVLQNEIKKLEICYNYYTAFSALNDCLSFNLKTLYRLYDLKKLHHFYSIDELRLAEKNAVVYHYEGGTVVGRPWENCDHYEIFDLWEKYKEKSPWRDMKRFDSKITPIHSIEKKLSRMLPLPIFILVYKMAYDLYWYRILKIRPNLS